MIDIKTKEIDINHLKLDLKKKQMFYGSVSLFTEKMLTIT